MYYSFCRVCLSTKNVLLHWPLVSYRAFIFHMSVPLGKSLSLVSRSSVKVKVKYQGYNLKKNGCCEGIYVSQT